MDFLRLFHNFGFNTPYAWLFPNPLALACFVLMVWSIAPAIKGVVNGGFTLFTRLTWAIFLLTGVSGVLLALYGLKVPSAVVTTDPTIIQRCVSAGVKMGQEVTKYCNLPDPKRNLEHSMYTVFVLGSLFFIELLIAGKLIERRKGLYFLPLVTLFMWGCAYMVGRVAVFPGSR